MDTDVAVRKLLLESPGVAETVGARVYPGTLPDDATLPAIVYELISDVPSFTNDRAHEPGECRRAVRYEVNCYHTRLGEARRLDGAARMALNGRHRLSGGTVVVFRQNSYPARYEDEKFWRVITDYMVNVGG